MPASLQPTLKRSLSLPLITLYGVGTTIGAGIFVLIGKVAASAHGFAPLSFLLAAVLAGFSAFAFAELSARYPQSAGEAVYVYDGLGSRRLALAVGLLVVVAGLISSAAIANGFVGYMKQLIALPDWLILVAVVVILGLIAAWGVTDSVTLATVITLIEIGGLLVVWAGRDSLATLPSRLPELIPPLDGVVWIGIVSGAVLAFYAFIGFEDMVNVAEEVKDVRRTLPRAIILTLVITTLLHMTVSLTAILVLPVDELAVSEAPVSLIFERATGRSATAISLIAIVSVLNGALIATALAAAVVLMFALALPLVTLAQMTSFVTLLIFATVNLALWRIKGRGPPPPGVPGYPRAFCLLGFLVSIAFAGFQAASALNWLLR